MKFDELIEKLLESTSPLRTLYHNTSIVNAGDIISYDYFHCEENEDDLKYRGIQPIHKKYPYFLSAARVPNNRYARRSTQFQSSVCLELDASKLTDHGYPIRPINFFLDYRERESEDRVLSKKKEIENFNQYIKSFHLFLHPIDKKRLTTNQNLHDMDKDGYNQVIKNILSTQKPAYFYEKSDDFHSLNRARREPLSEKHTIR